MARLSIRQKLNDKNEVYEVNKWKKYAGPCLEAAGLVLLADVLFYRRLIAFIPVSVLAVFYVRLRLRAREEKEKKLLARQFRELLRSLEVSLRAGYAIENAFAAAERDLAETLGREAAMTGALRRINARTRLREPPENAFASFAEESGVEDIRDFSAVLSASRRTGGRMGSLARAAAVTIGDKLDVEAEIESAVAAKRYEQTLMSFLPCGILLYLQLISPGFLEVLYTTALGAAVMTVCLAIYIAAVLWGRKIVNIRV